MVYSKSEDFVPKGVKIYHSLLSRMNIPQKKNTLSHKIMLFLSKLNYSIRNKVVFFVTEFF